MKDTNKFAPVAVAPQRERGETGRRYGVGEAWLVLTASLGGRIIYAVPFPLPISIHFPPSGFVCLFVSSCWPHSLGHDEFLGATLKSPKVPYTSLALPLHSSSSPSSFPAAVALSS